MRGERPTTETLARHETDNPSNGDHTMFSQWIISTIRADETLQATSPATVLRRMESEQTLGRPGPLSSALVSALWGACGAAAVRP